MNTSTAAGDIYKWLGLPLHGSVGAKITESNHRYYKDKPTPKWQKHFNPEQVNFIESACGKVLEWYGFDRKYGL